MKARGVSQYLGPSVLPRALNLFLAAMTAALIAAGPLSPRDATAAGVDPAAHDRESVCRIVDGAAAANRLPAGFLARILWQESRLRSEAVSSAGAEGVAQFMPQTAAEHGLADPRDPASAIAAAARLLANLKIQLGNLGLAAAAYNAGAGRVIRWLHRQSDLPAETQLYVVAVTGRSAEEWKLALGISQMPGGEEPCLAVIPDLARAASTRSAPLGWASRLDRDLARAIGVGSMLPLRQRDAGLESLRASFAMCERIRSLGARCAVYQP